MSLDSVHKHTHGIRHPEILSYYAHAHAREPIYLFVLMQNWNHGCVEVFNNECIMFVVYFFGKINGGCSNNENFIYLNLIFLTEFKSLNQTIIKSNNLKISVG